MVAITKSAINQVKHQVLMKQIESNFNRSLSVKLDDIYKLCKFSVGVYCSKFTLTYENSSACA